MDKNSAINKIQEKIDKTSELEKLDIFNNLQHKEEFETWKNDTEMTLKNIFQDDKIFYDKFNNIDFGLDYNAELFGYNLEDYKKGLASARAVLKSAISQRENFSGSKDIRRNSSEEQAASMNFVGIKAKYVKARNITINGKKELAKPLKRDFDDTRITEKRAKNKPYAEGSILHLASIGFETITNLSKSQTITDKLIGFNGLIISFIISILLTTQLFPSAEFLTSIIALVVFFLFSLVGMIGYIPLIETLASLTENKITGLKFSIYLLFLALISSIIGISLNLVIVKYVAYFLLGSQLLIIPAGFILPKSNIENKEISFNGLWDVLGKVGIVLGIISGLITIISVISKPF